MVGQWTEIRDRLAVSHPRLHVRAIECDGHQWLDLALELGAIADFARSAVLLHNWVLAVGQLSQADDKLLLWQTLPLEGLADDVIDETVEGLYVEAERARSALGGAS